MNKKIYLTYDDIQLIPKFSSIKSRKDISLKTLVSRRYGLLIPLVASPMDTVCEEEMAFKMFLLGGVGCIHRFMTDVEQAKQIKSLCARIYSEKFFSFENWHSEIKQIPIMAAIGVQDEDKNRALLLTESGANILIIDVAHGHHQNVINMIQWCKNNLPPEIDIIAGNIATSNAAIDLENAGADGLRVGIGGGCFTPDMKVKTSNGYIPIIDVKIGDKVYSHNGELNEVIHKFEFDRNEEIMIINDIECTKNHEFYVVNKKYADLVNKSNIEKYSEWISAENLTNNYFLVEI